VLVFFSAAALYKHPVVRCKTSRVHLNIIFVPVASWGRNIIQGISLAVDMCLGLAKFPVDRRRLVAWWNVIDVLRIVCRIPSAFKASHARKQSSSKSLRREHQICCKWEMAWKNLFLQTVASERLQHVVRCLFSTLSHQMHAIYFVMWRSCLSAACDGELSCTGQKSKIQKLLHCQ